MKFDEYRQFDAVGLADLVARKETTPGELLDCALARAAEVNPVINAITVDLEDRARADISAGLPQGPLHGVPYLIKDVTVQMKGVPTSYGSRLFKDKPAEFDSALVTAYREAGMVLFGKTATPEFGLTPFTEPLLTGATRNPWNTDLTPGGSSGGASAAIASGIVPAAHGSDGGGSIRIPAGCCGLFGLKPSRGRVSLAPGGEGWGGMAVQNALSRSVRDSALLLDISCKPQPGDPYYLDPPVTPFLEEVGRDPGRLKIAFSTSALIFGDLAPECVAAVRDAAKLCEELGHEVIEVKPDANYIELTLAANVLVSSAIATVIKTEGERRGKPVTEEEVEPLTWRVYQDGLTKSATDVVQAQQAVNTFSRRFAEFFERYDVSLNATMGTPPPPVGFFPINDEDPMKYAMALYRFIPNTSPFNAGGQPCANIPLYWSEANVPIGTMFGAATGREAVLFRLAGQLEQARPWMHRYPPL